MQLFRTILLYHNQAYFPSVLFIIKCSGHNGENSVRSAGGAFYRHWNDIKGRTGSKEQINKNEGSGTFLSGIPAFGDPSLGPVEFHLFCPPVHGHDAVRQKAVCDILEMCRGKDTGKFNGTGKDPDRFR